MENSSPGTGLSPFKVLRALRSRKLFLVIPALLLTAGAAVYTRGLPVRFRAQALVAAEPIFPGGFLTGRAEASAAVINVQDQLRVIRETLLSDAVLATVAREFKLDDSTTGKGLDHAIENLKAKIQIQVEGPNAFFIGFEGKDRHEVMEITNRLAELFIGRTSDLRGRRVRQEDRFLDGEVDGLRRQLSAQEESIKAYKQSAAEDLPERLTTNLKQLEDLRQQIQAKTDQITEGQAKRLAVIEEMQALESKGALEVEPPEKSATEVALESARLRLAQLRTRYEPGYPEIQRTEKEIHDLESMRKPATNRRGPTPAYLRYISLKGELASAEQRLKSYLQERASLSSDLVNYESRVNSSPGLEAELAQRMRATALTRSRYEALFAKQQEAKLTQRAEESTNGVTFRIVEPASLPAAPSGPQPRRLMLMALLAGLGLGLAAVLAAEQMDTSFATVEELQGFTNVPVLSAAPAISNRTFRMHPGSSGNQSASFLKPHANGFTPSQKRSFQQHRLAVLSSPQSIATEQYGVLSLKVQKWMRQTGGQVLVVTSAAGGEGKSVTAINLSLALAASMEGRVLLIDSDLRRPQVHQYLGLNDSKGFGDLLAEKSSDVHPYITKVGHLHTISGGAQPANPVGLLASPYTRETLARLKKEFQLIVVDSPPIVPIADSHILAGLADGVLIVVRARQTRRELFQRAIESLDATNVLGVVLNDVQYADSSYAHACRYYHRHYLRRR